MGQCVLRGQEAFNTLYELGVCMCVCRGGAPSGVRVLVCPSLLSSQACVHHPTMGGYIHIWENLGIRILGKGYVLKGEGARRPGCDSISVGRYLGVRMRLRVSWLCFSGRGSVAGDGHVPG